MGKKSVRKEKRKKKRFSHFTFAKMKIFHPLHFYVCIFFSIYIHSYKLCWMMPHSQCLELCSQVVIGTTEERAYHE